ncbi:MAG TPA: 50S ribosomal protein L9 [Gammaproteobacteria bacterium]|jgi:large subunit ribosomal protein L9|nr:50S ribosomal protein L9 [Gammaproteobacteria bacterium]
MDVILLKKVDNLGGLGERVKVKAGYGRNYLIPQGMAAPATAENVAAFEARRAELEREAAESLAAAEARRAELEQLPLSITVKAGSEGKLFGSVGTVDVAELVSAAGIPIERKEVRLPNGPIRIAGEHEVEFHFHADVSLRKTITVIGEE